MASRERRARLEGGGACPVARRIFPAEREARTYECADEGQQCGQRFDTADGPIGLLVQAAEHRRLNIAALEKVGGRQ